MLLPLLMNLNMFSQAPIPSIVYDGGGGGGGLGYIKSDNSFYEKQLKERKDTQKKILRDDNEVQEIIKMFMQCLK